MSCGTARSLRLSLEPGPRHPQGNAASQKPSELELRCREQPAAPLWTVVSSSQTSPWGSGSVARAAWKLNFNYLKLNFTLIGEFNSSKLNFINSRMSLVATR